MEAFLQSYGYLAVMLGTFLEGETILVLAALAAHQGYMTLEWVILSAFAGSLCGDQFFFYLGRRHSDLLLRRRPAWRDKLERAGRLVARFQTPLILGFRFLYGLRSVMPFAFGMSDLPVLRFVSLNIVGAGIWALTVGIAGYLFGHALEQVLGDLRQYERRLFILVAVAGAILWMAYLYRCRHGPAHRNGCCQEKETP